MKKTEEVLLIDIQELINAYHEGLADNIAKRPTDTNVNIGMAQPLTSMQMVLETNLVASELSFAKLATTLIEEQEQALSFAEIKKEAEEYTSQYAECYTTDIKGKRQEDIDFFTDDTLTESNWDEGKALHKQRLTNDLNYKLMMPLTKDFDEKYFGKEGTLRIGGEEDGHDLNFGLEKCFDCVIKVNLSYAMPALEFTFNFAQQLRKLKELLKQINADLDPTKILSMICQMSLNFGKNLICPSNLLGISLLLPHLFTKYSLDLVKLRFDWTVVLGPIIKTIVGSIVSFVENIPRLIVPFIDCFINVFKNTIKWISTMMSSAENVYNAAHTGIEKTAQLIDRAHTSAKEMLEATPLLDSKLEALEEELEATQKKLGGRFNESDNKDIGDWLTSAYEKIKGPGVYLADSEKAEASHQALKPAFNAWQKDNDLSPPETPEATRTQLRDFLVANPVHLKAVLALDPVSNALAKAIAEKVKYYEDETARDENKREARMLERAIARETLAAKNRKKYFRLDGVIEDTHRKHSVAAFRKIGVDIENKYKESPFKLPLKANFESGRKAVKDLITHYTIRHLEATKSWILQTAGNVILALKGIERFLGEYIETDLKILGNIQEILHLIRFYRLLYELIKNGLTGCDKIKENKQVFETILQESNQELVLDDSILEKQNLDPQDHIALKSKDGRYSTIIDLNQCNEVMNHINVNENNLDSIYDGILNGLYT